MAYTCLTHHVIGAAFPSTLDPAPVFGLYVGPHAMHIHSLCCTVFPDAGYHTRPLLHSVTPFAALCHFAVSLLLSILQHHQTSHSHSGIACNAVLLLLMMFA